MKLMTRGVSGALAALLVLFLAAITSAQESKSASLAKQLAAAMDAGQLE